MTIDKEVSAATLLEQLYVRPGDSISVLFDNLKRSVFSFVEYEYEEEQVLFVCLDKENCFVISANNGCCMSIIGPKVYAKAQYEFFLEKRRIKYSILTRFVESIGGTMIPAQAKPCNHLYPMPRSHYEGANRILNKHPWLKG